VTALAAPGVQDCATVLNLVVLDFDALRPAIARSIWSKGAATAGIAVGYVRQLMVPPQL
jgi:hypothetical protein